MDHSSRTRRTSIVFQCYVSMASERVVIDQHKLTSNSNRVAVESHRQRIDFGRLSNSRGFNTDWIEIAKFSSRKGFISLHQRRVTFFLEFIPLRKHARIIGLIVCQVSSKQTIKRWDLPCCSFSERFGDAGMCEYFPSAALLEHRPIRERHIPIDFHLETMGSQLAIVDELLIFADNISSTADHLPNR